MITNKQKIELSSLRDKENGFLPGKVASLRQKSAEVSPSEFLR